MAPSAFTTAQYSSDQFVESSGAILFDFSQETAKVCLIYYIKKDEWLLAKGRRNCYESRPDAALREVQEETGYRCHLYPITMPTRAPAATSTYDIPDQARTYNDLTEPFMLSIREIKKSNVKLIWWYIAEVEKGVQKADSEPGFTSEFFDCDEAIQRLTFQGDRNVLTKAVSLVNGSSWLKNQRDTYELLSGELEKLLCVTDDRIQSLVAPEYNYPWDSIDNVELLPSFFGEASNDLFIEWIYIIDLDEEIFSVNNSIFFDLWNVPRERWLEAFEGTRYSTTICSEASLSPLTPEYFTDDAERDKYKDIYGKYSCSTLDGLTDTFDADLRQVVAVMLLECLLRPSSQMWDFVPQWGAHDFAFRELAFAILSLAAGEYYLTNLGELHGKYENVETSSGFLVSKASNGRQEVFPILGRGCHTPNSEPGSAPPDSMYYFRGILISLVTPTALKKDTAATIAKAVEFGLQAGKKDLQIVIFSIKSVVFVKVSVEGETKSVSHTEVVTVTRARKYGVDYSPSTMPTAGTELSQKAHPGFTLLQAIFHSHVLEQISSVNQGLFPTEIYTEILSNTDPLTQFTCTKVSPTFHNLCQRQLALGNGLAITKYKAATYEQKDGRFVQTKGVFGTFTFNNRKTGTALRSCHDPSSFRQSGETSSRWCAVIGAGARKSIVSQGFLGITFD